MNDFLSISGVSKSFGKTPVLNNIGIAAREGEFLVLVGPSGCGKSTLLSIIAGLEPADEGSIAIGGEDMSERPPAQRDIAMVFQSYALYPNMSVRQNIAFGMEMRGIAKADRERAVQEVAATLHIEALLDRKPSQLSGGQRQRVAMGRALVRKPRVFLFDEPLSNLDAKLRVDMRTEIKKLHQRLNATIVYVTHDQVEAMTLATKIVVMDGGITRQIGAPDDIYNRPADLFVASFMGSPAMNLLRGKLRHEGDAIHVCIGSQRLPLPPDAAAAVEHLATESDIVLGLRPEHIAEHNAARATPSAALTPLALVAEVIEPAGADTYLISKLGDQPITARLRADCRAQPGQQLTVACDMQRALLFHPQTGKRFGAE